LNIDTGELRRITKENEEELARAGFVQVPFELAYAARFKLAGKDSAQVSLTSGGKLSKWAAQQRKLARKKRARARTKKNRRRMAQESRRRNRII
jgi:hypothetical protein